MIKPSWTPGPWHWDDTVWNYDPEQQAPWLVNGNGERVLSGQIHCTEADARLIAMAPELFEALQMFLVEKPIDEVISYAEECKAKARAAIAKALGETQ
jgi:hypothetical protein